MDKEYLDIYILAHGTEGELHCAGQSMGTHGEEYSFSDLESVTVSVINLYCCNGATINADGYSIASILANLTGAPVVAVANGKVNFSWYGCYPEAVRGGEWTTVKPDLR